MESQTAIKLTENLEGHSFAGRIKAAANKGICADFLGFNLNSSLTDQTSIQLLSLGTYCLKHLHRPIQNWIE